MRKLINRSIFPLIAFSFLLVVGSGGRPVLAWDIPKEVPGNFEGKWYGIHCPLIKEEQMVGERGGDAYPNQKIINTWRYKANQIEEIKDILPDQYYRHWNDLTHLNWIRRNQHGKTG